MHQPKGLSGAAANQIQAAPAAASPDAVELWDVLTADRRPTGRCHRRGETLAAGDYHLVVLVWLVNEKNDFVITLRHPDKPWPGLWECTGGSVLAGEDSLAGAVREVADETGLDLPVAAAELILSYLGYDTIYDVWLCRCQADLSQAVLQPAEVTAIRLATSAEIRAMLAAGSMVPSLRRSFQAVCGRLGLSPGPA